MMHGSVFSYVVVLLLGLLLGVALMSIIDKNYWSRKYRELVRGVNCLVKVIESSSVGGHSHE
jgi:hypothetical protein